MNNESHGGCRYGCLTYIWQFVLNIIVDVLFSDELPDVLDDGCDDELQYKYSTVNVIVSGARTMAK